MEKQVKPVSDVLQSTDFRLSYGDCDPLGIVYYAAYYPWMERVYNEWVFENAITPPETFKKWGVNTVMKASGCEYLVPGVLFDALTCRLRLKKIGNTSFTVWFEIARRKDEVTVATGHMVFVMVDGTMKPSPVPDPMIALYTQRPA